MEWVARHTEKMWQGHQWGDGKTTTAIWRGSCRGANDHNAEGYRSITEETKEQGQKGRWEGDTRNSITPAIYTSMAKPPKPLLRHLHIIPT